MKEWTREERYRVLHSPDEIRDLYERISNSAYRQTYHVQPVTGLSSDPTDLPGITGSGICSISGAHGVQSMV